MTFSFVGGHILSGAVIETRALQELFPNWKELDTPLKTPVTVDSFAYLTESKRYNIPVFRGK